MMMFSNFLSLFENKLTVWSVNYFLWVKHPHFHLFIARSVIFCEVNIAFQNFYLNLFWWEVYREQKCSNILFSKNNYKNIWNFINIREIINLAPFCVFQLISACSSRLSHLLSGTNRLSKKSTLRHYTTQRKCNV